MSPLFVRGYTRRDFRGYQITTFSFNTHVVCVCVCVCVSNDFEPCQLFTYYYDSFNMHISLLNSAHMILVYSYTEHLLALHSDLCCL